MGGAIFAVTWQLLCSYEHMVLAMQGMRESTTRVLQKADENVVDFCLVVWCMILLS